MRNLKYRLSAWDGLAPDGVVFARPLATGANVAAKAGLGWAVEKHSLAALVGESAVPFPDGSAALVALRPEGPVPVSPIKGLYRPIQNVEAFEAFDPVLREIGAKYVAAGSMLDGRLVWAWAEIPKPLAVVMGADGDRVLFGLIISNQHGRNGVLRAHYVVRRQSNHTVLVSGLHNDREDQITFRHLPTTPNLLRDVSGVTEKVKRHMTDMLTLFRKMSSTRISQVQVEEFLGDVFGRGTGMRLKNMRSRSMWCLRSSANSMPGARGTLWGAFGAVVEWSDLWETVPKDAEASWRRPFFQWFGIGAGHKERALEVAKQCCAKN